MPPSRAWLLRIAQKLLKLGDRIFGRLASRAGIRVIDVYPERIGETAQRLDIFVKMGELGWRPRFRAIVIAPPSRVVNADLLERWKPYVRIWSGSRATRVLENAVFSSHLSYTPSVFSYVKDSPPWYLEDFRAVVEAEWERQGRGPLLRLSPHDEARGRAALAELGLPADAWFVALHVREPGFLRETQTSHRQHRNADVRTYLPAVQAIVERGGWVIRLGDPTMTPLPALEHVVDYPHQELRHDWLDVYLAAACRFFLGMPSGMISVARCFGVRIAATNWLPFSTVPPGRDIYIPKLYRSTTEDRVLSLSEMLTPELFHCFDGRQLSELGVEPVNNSEEELRELTVEMLDRLDGTAAYSDEDELRQARFRSLMGHFDGDLMVNVGRDFLRRHADLLPPG